MKVQAWIPDLRFAASGMTRAFEKSWCGGASRLCASVWWLGVDRLAVDQQALDGGLS